MADSPMHIKDLDGGIIKVFFDSEPPYATLKNRNGSTLDVHLLRGDDGRYTQDKGESYSLLRTCHSSGTYRGTPLELVITKRSAERIQAADDKRQKEG